MRIPETPFIPAPKTPRLSRECLVTEKLDGAWGAVVIDDSGEIFAASRNRWITPENDNFGFARWVEGNKQELLKLGPGRHPGEWFGLGIQRHYDLKEKRFSLFNASRWIPNPSGPGVIELAGDKQAPARASIAGPSCCYVVPTLYLGEFNTCNINDVLEGLRRLGSLAAPGFMQPEGIVVYHTAAGVCFKKTIKDDETPKSLVDNG